MKIEDIFSSESMYQLKHMFLEFIFCFESNIRTWSGMAFWS